MAAAPARRRADAPAAAPAPAPAPRRRRRRGPGWVTVLAWVTVAGLAAISRLGEELGRVTTAPAAPDDTTAARHEPVVVQGDWMHAPVAVLAERPPEPPKPLKPTVAESRKPRELPRPFAALRALSTPLLMPRLRLPRALHPEFPAIRSLLARARPGQPVHVVLSAYCLRGTTRRGTQVRPGIIAADPSIFPLGRHVELYAGGRYFGRFRVEDTGSRIRGTRIDIWTPDCADAQRFGMRPGIAALVALGD